MPFEIPIKSSAEFDFKSKSHIFSLRTSEVKRYPQLTVDNYEPDPAVFEMIVDGKPWWGLWGLFFYGQGSSSIDGLSEESRWILNPFLLAHPEFYGLSIWGDLKWNEKSISETDFKNAQFPLYPKPKSLYWQPVKSKAEVVYDLKRFLQAVNPYLISPLNISHVDMDLSLCNARDLGLPWAYISLKNSKNIKQQKHNSKPFKIRGFIHVGNSCKIKGGCNNVSPYYEDVSHIQITALPALLQVHLWSEADSLSLLPKMIFNLRFE